MAMRWIEGFEASYHLEPLKRIYTGSQTNITASNRLQGPYTTNDNAANSSGAQVFHTPELVSVAENTWIVGFDVRVNNDNMASKTNYVAFRDGTGEQFRVELIEVLPSPDVQRSYAPMKLRVMRGATELARSVQTFNMDSQNYGWWRFEIKATITNTGSVEVKVSRPSKSSYGTITVDWDNSLASVDIQDQASSGATSVALAMQSMALDNWIIMDNTGTTNNDYVGLVRVYASKPSVAGTHNDWSLAGGATTTQGALNESVSSDDDDQRVSSGTIGNKASANVPNFPTGEIGDNAPVLGLRFDQAYRMETAGTITSIGMMRIGTTDYDIGSDVVMSSTTLASQSDILETSPATAAAFTKTEIEGFEIGVRHKA